MMMMMTFMNRLSLLGLLLIPGTFAQFPLNDECVNATVIPSNTALPYTTSPIPFNNASYNYFDPVTSCNATSLDFPKGTDGATMWYSFMPSTTGLFAFSTTESTLNMQGDFSGNFSSIIGIFTGSACNSLQEVTCSRLRMGVTAVNLVAGTPYYIKVGTFDDEVGGQLKLSVKVGTPPPPNAQCANAVAIDPVAGQAITDTIDFAFTKSEYGCSYTSIQTKGLWYKFTNVLSYPVSITVTTCSENTNFDTIINIFEGTDCGSLGCVGGNDDFTFECGLASTITFLASEQSTYYILVEGINDEDAEGKFTLTVNSSPNYFAVIDSKLDEVSDVLGQELQYGLVPPKLNIQAVFANDVPVQSVRVTFDNPARSSCELAAPYSVFGDTDGDYYDASIPLGPHKVKATAYAQSGCNGPAGPSISNTFDVRGCSTSFIIVEADTGNFVYFLTSNPSDDPDFANIVDAIPCKVNIELDIFCGFDITSVQLDLRNLQSNRIIKSQKEFFTPYYLFGNDGDTINSGSIGPGTYNISATIDGIKHPDVEFQVSNACYSV
jgi:hypothetical protein